MKQSPKAFYQEQLEEATLLHQNIKQRLAWSSVLRLLVFVVVCFGVYVAFGNTKVVLAIFAAGIVLFVFLLTRHKTLQYKRDFYSALVEQNITEIEALKRNFDALYDEGEHFMNLQHFYSQDIDLFGYASFYHYINRTNLPVGAKALAAMLTENNTEQIRQKQEAVQELSKLAKWRQAFSAIASMVKTEVSSSLVLQWLETYRPFAPHYSKALSVGFSVISICVVVLYFLEIISGYVLLGWFLLGLFISGTFFKKINKLSQHNSKIQSTFEQYSKLISEIEHQEFFSTLLSEKKALIVNPRTKASTTLKTFSKLLDALDQRNNMMVGIFLNGFMLRDLYITSKIENWIAQHTKEVTAWFNTITFFDAYNSLGNYAFNHPHQAFPEITDSKTILDVKGAGHPLLDPATMVRNDYTINQREFFIVTGANMAGKSTFLRTVSLHIVMANMGLPICADAARYSPIKLITSMRTTDSLSNDESYFFSELKRLRFIVDHIETDRYFIILDEILKGTNSKDKAIGSLKFVERLVAGNSTGIIATHDLSLCEISKTYPQVQNYYFDAQIINNELFFDYCFKPGICQNMNASFLLKKMNIIE